ncbi:hypothetical protein PLICRDRAFT_47803 [Plicaturopsis crispa FD-325 SS-3]|nr:hypothetical protein PLICRDRAFT_47803 [Plicaturopsis crispa FD-325 SS-3]
MGILGHGVDLVHLPRISSILQRRGPAGLAKRILSPEEHVDWEALPPEPSSSARFLAVRWGVKEAAYKALYPAVRPTWKELTYHGFRGDSKPTLSYTPFLPEDKAKTGRMHVSVSHDGDYVLASVIVEEAREK